MTTLDLLEDAQAVMDVAIRDNFPPTIVRRAAAIVRALRRQLVTHPSCVDCGHKVRNHSCIRCPSCAANLALRSLP